ncbi:MAG: WD40 repeat domain-containing protein [Anaerolineae bacterium]|jgi:WD40 repeat protein|nr:WD40 repeat domain-containing protein [Anaerolineae bacterium]
MKQMKHIMILLLFSMVFSFTPTIAQDSDLPIVIDVEKASQLQEITALKTDGLWINELEFHPSGEFLAVLETSSPYDGYRGFQGKITLWQTSTWENVNTLGGEDFSITSMSFHSNGIYIASGTVEGEILIWNWQFEELAGRIQGHETQVNAVHFESGGGGIISGSGAVYSSPEIGDTSITLWNTNPLEEFSVLVPDDTEWGAALDIIVSPRNGLRAVGMSDGQVRLWGSESNTLRAMLDGYTNTRSILFTADDAGLLFPSYDGVRIWNVRAAYRSFGYVPEYRLIAPIAKPDAPLDEREFIFSIALNPAESVLAVGYHDGMVRLWDMMTGERLMVLEAHNERITALAFSPDGTLLASGGADGTVRLWGIPMGEG